MKKVIPTLLVAMFAAFGVLSAGSAFAGPDLPTPPHPGDLPAPPHPGDVPAPPRPGDLPDPLGIFDKDHSGKHVAHGHGKRHKRHRHH